MPKAFDIRVEKITDGLWRASVRSEKVYGEGKSIRSATDDLLNQRESMIVASVEPVGAWTVTKSKKNGRVCHFFFSGSMMSLCRHADLMQIAAVDGKSRVCRTCSNRLKAD